MHHNEEEHSSPSSCPQTPTLREKPSRGLWGERRAAEFKSALGTETTTYNTHRYTSNEQERQYLNSTLKTNQPFKTWLPPLKKEHALVRYKPPVSQPSHGLTVPTPANSSAACHPNVRRPQHDPPLHAPAAQREEGAPHGAHYPGFGLALLGLSRPGGLTPCAPPRKLRSRLVFSASTEQPHFSSAGGEPSVMRDRKLTLTAFSHG